MKDYLKDFRTRKTKKNVIIVLSSLMVALVLNGFLFGTPVGNKLQTSVKNYSTQDKKEVTSSDIYLEKSGTGSDLLNLKIGTDLKKVNKISLSVISNPEGIQINDIVSDNNNYQIIKSSSVPGIFMVVINVGKTEDIKAGTVVAKIIYTKKSADKASINLAETQFSSEGSSYELQNSGVEF